MSRQLNARDGEFPRELETDICIIGAGAAGITIAANLEHCGKRVLLLEAGDSQLEGQTQHLYAAEQTGLRYFDLTSCRLRFFGGTTNHWGGYCRENDPIDYEGRPDLGVPSWPVGYAEIKPYVDRAAEFLGLDAAGFDPAVAATRHGIERGQLLESRSDTFLTKVFQISRRLHIQDLYGEVLKRQANLDIVRNANVTGIRLTPDGTRVSHLDVRAFGKDPFRVRARRFVLAVHAIETARLLLASDDVVPAGIGNHSGMVGRHFMEHPNVISGLMFPTARFSRFYDRKWAATRQLNANLSFSAKAMRREGILQYYCRFRPLADYQYGYEHIGDAVGELQDNFWSPADRETLRALATVLGDLPNSLRYGSERLAGRPADLPVYELDHRIEQAPNPESRVVLSEQTDALGVRKAVFHWDLNELDYHTFARGQEVVVREFTRLGLARFDAPALTPEKIRPAVRGHNHHIGTARMSEDRSTGVVDRNGRVHEVENLYLCGSATFPTSGYSGPTMMIIAFALRMAEHLQQSIEQK